MVLLTPGKTFRNIFTGEEEGGGGGNYSVKPERPLAMAVSNSFSSLTRCHYHDDAVEVGQYEVRVVRADDVSLGSGKALR